MAIDDLSFERALERLRLEDLSRAPGLATSLPGIVVKAIAALLGGDLTQATDLFTQCQETLESGRSKYLLQCVVDDLNWLRGELDKLNQKQQEYLSTDWVALLVDADKKARATLGKTRIERIAKILCSSIRIEPIPPVEQTEELTRVAMELTDNDAGIMREETERAGRAAVVFASAVSQDAFLGALRAQEIDWTRITAFHMDEYAGMSADHPASFRRFLRERLFDHVPVAAFHQLDGEAADAAAECERYAGLLRRAEPCLVIMGIGENGHLAFIDPPVCDFDDPRDVRTVELDDVCRMQQVHDGAFARLEEVPRRALSLTVPFFLRVPRALVFVNGEHKSAAVRAALRLGLY